MNATYLRHILRSIAFLTCAIAWTITARAAAISIATVPVGDPGNTADTTVMTGGLPDGTSGYGSVSYKYSIGTYEVTATQYTAFLNAVAASDPYGLYNSNMGNGFATSGISQSGTSGHFTYATTKNGNYPVNYVTWGDAARFVNWLQNGQPMGAEGNATTEAGTYSLNGATTNTALMATTIVRNPSAKWVLPTENEWYKAAYYKGGGTNAGYWAYPTQSDTDPSNTLSATGTNNANYYIVNYTDPTNYLTPVGAFAASPGPYGTFDQGGDVWDWNETAVIPGSDRGLRGGAFNSNNNYLLPSYRNYSFPIIQSDFYGFRVAYLPEPGSLTLLALGACGFLALACRRERATMSQSRI